MYVGLNSTTQSVSTHFNLQKGYKYNINAKHYGRAESDPTCVICNKIAITRQKKHVDSCSMLVQTTEIYRKIAPDVQQEHSHQTLTGV